MRDPKRIPFVLKAVQAYWQRNPDLRLAQVIGNCVAGDPYHLEDDELVRLLEARMGQSSVYPDPEFSTASNQDKAQG